MGPRDLFDWEDMPCEEAERPKRKRPRAGEWTTKSGETIAFKDMDHAHLLNTIACLERQFRGLQDTFNQEALDIDLLFPAHAGLVAEARRRGLVPKTKDRMVTA